MTASVIDWAAKPEPWRSIGPAFRADCEAIVAAPVAGPAPLTPMLRGRRREVLRRAFAAAKEAPGP